jgi:tetratricopeptide (TPR) repeat protein
MAKSTRNPLKHLAGGFFLLSLHLGTLPTFAQTQAIPTAEQTAQLAEANRLNQQVTQLYQQGQYAAALPLAQKALAIREQLLGANHPDVATSLNNLAGLYQAIGNYGEAEPLFQRSLTIREQALGSDHPRVATSLNNLAALYSDMGNYTEAQPLYQRSLAIFEQALGSDHPRVATSLNNLAGLYSDMGNYSEAEPLYQRALAIREQALGSDHPDVATSLNNLALLYSDMGNYSEAEPLYQRALAIREQALGSDHPSVAQSLNNLAELYREMGNYTEAFPLYQRALAIFEQALGSDHPDVATSLNNLAGLYDSMGNYTEAFPLYQRALAIWEQALGSDHPRVATSLNNLAGLYDSMGNYSEAEPLLQRALAIREQTLGQDHFSVATSLNDLAALYQDMGNYSEAEPLLQRALAIREQVLGKDHPDVANSLHNLAALYQAMGNYSEAETLYQRALAISEQAFGKDHLDVTRTLNNLAVLYQVMGNYSEAERLFQRALVIREQALGSDHLDVARTLNGLAALYRDMGNYSEAEPLFQRALVIREQALDSDHLDVANSLHNLAELYQDMGNYSEAKPLKQRTLAIVEQVLGSNHPIVAISLNRLAILYQAQGDMASATDYLSRGLSIQENNLSLIFTTGSEAQKRAYMNTLSDETHAAISLHLQDASNNPEAANLALTTLLRRKGRILDALTDNIQLIRENLTPENQQFLDQLTDTRTQLANLIYKKPENINQDAYKTQVANLKAQANQLEAELSRRSAEFRTISQPVTIAAIQQQIPTDAALVELTLYYPYDAKTDRFGNPRYAAYILQATGTPQWVDLGEAAPIDAAAKALQNSLASQDSSLDVLQENARQLDALLMQPIRAKLGDKTHILLSPDSQLNLIPFAALVDENNQYLVENYQITYLTTGRDLLRLQNQQEPRQASVIVANPNYDEPGVNNSQVASTRGSNRLISGIDVLIFDPLPGTAAEADAIQPLLTNATVLTEAKATEQAIKQVEAPRILHIATHGFFVDVDLVAPAANPFENLGDLGIQAGPDTDTSPPAPVNKENPLLRSGLALAGFNTRSSGGFEDGALTALEVAGLNLRGTQLVVLSACETGVGDVANGEGVYGLRRALAIAGAESQVISLWNVKDGVTKDLMVDYYQRLIDGEGRSAALREVQLAMLNSPNYQHPYFWASFIPSGEWAAMD